MFKPPGEMQSHNSSNLVGSRYDEAARTLTVDFRGGRRYEYSGVPMDVAGGLRTASSAGEYFARHIKGRFSTKRIA